MEQNQQASQMKALLLDAEQRTATVKSIPIPTPGPNEVLIKVHAIALNPVDSLYTFSPLGATGRVVGSDFAGTVVQSTDPPSTTSRRLQPSQRVAGFLQGACSRNDRPGAFAEYIVCPEDLLWLVPDDITLEDAATISLCGLTAAQAIFLRLGFEAPFERQSSSQSARLGSATAHGRDTRDPDPFYVLIYGASTSVGLYAAQLIHRALPPSSNGQKQRIVLIGLASPARFPLLQSHPYSYSHLLDYRSPTWPTSVLALTNGKGIDLALDCISEGSTVANVSRTLRSQGKLAVTRSLEGEAWDSSDLKEGITPSYGAVWEGLGERVEYQGFVVEGSEESRECTRAFYEWLSATGGDGKGRLVANPIRHMPGGLEKVVEDGFALLGGGSMGDRRGERGEEWMRPISGEKMVYRIGE